MEVPNRNRRARSRLALLAPFGLMLCSFWFAANVIGQDDAESPATRTDTVPQLPSDLGPGYGVPDTRFGPSTETNLTCTGGNNPPNFRAYHASEEIAGLRLNAVLRRCDIPFPGEPVRANFISFIYGDCTPPIDPATGHADGGCAAPLEIQTWPACERTWADYDLGSYFAPSAGPPSQRRGVPAIAFDQGTRLELYPGRSTVVIFAGDPAIASRAADALRTLPPDATPASARANPENLRESGGGGNLPAPAAGAMEGKLSCKG